MAKTSDSKKELAKNIQKRLTDVVTWPWRVFEKICFAVGLIVILLGTVFGLLTAQFFAALPKIGNRGFKDLKVLAEKRIEKKREGRGTRPKWTPIENISKPFLYAIVMSEDSLFFQHDGINPEAVVAAALNTLRKKKIEGGASTISQQVVKNVLLSDERSIRRKLKEILVTEELEKRLKKNEILELYLNLIEVGPDLYGVDAAAHAYFRKSPSQITAGEGAIIALLLPSPRRYHFTLFENHYLPKELAKKYRRILGDLLSQDIITPTQYKESSRQDYLKKIFHD